jgi:hypothetical protein
MNRDKAELTFKFVSAVASTLAGVFTSGRLGKDLFSGDSK